MIPASGVTQSPKWVFQGFSLFHIIKSQKGFVYRLGTIKLHSEKWEVILLVNFTQTKLSTTRLLFLHIKCCILPYALCPQTCCLFSYIIWAGFFLPHTQGATKVWSMHHLLTEVAFPQDPLQEGLHSVDIHCMTMCFYSAATHRLFYCCMAHAKVDK